MKNANVYFEKALKVSILENKDITKNIMVDDTNAKISETSRNRNNIDKLYLSNDTI